MQSETLKWRRQQINMNAVFDAHPKESSYVLMLLEQGLIDGGTYDPTLECACLFGSVARHKKCSKNWARQQSYKFLGKYGCFGAAEDLFVSIAPDDTPQNSHEARRAARLIRLWLARNPKKGK
jgi:hypothetical protein